MKIWPKENYNVATKKPVNKILQSLRMYTREKTYVPTIFFPRKGKPFIGVIGDTHFALQYAAWERMTMPPVINGIIITLEESNIVQIKMRVPVYVTTFFIVWVSICGLFQSLIIYFLISGQNFNFGMLMPLILAVFAFVIINFGFRKAVRLCKQSLAKILV